MHTAHMATFDNTITYFYLGLVNAHRANNSDDGTNVIPSKEIHACFFKKSENFKWPSYTVAINSKWSLIYQEVPNTLQTAVDLIQLCM